MKIAIVGSRDFKDKKLVEEILLKELNPFHYKVITGGARGVDTWAKEFCEKDHIPCEIIIPINPSNKIDYLFRNIEIITKADKIIVFWDGLSKGSKFVIDYAKARNKEVKIIKPNERR